MDDEMRARIKAEAQRVIDNRLSFKKIVVGSPVDYSVPGVSELRFEVEDIDEVVANFTGGQSFDEYFNFLVDKKDLAGLERFYDWCSQKGREMLSTTHVDKQVRRVWLQYVGRLDDEVERLKEEIL